MKNKKKQLEEKRTNEFYNLPIWAWILVVIFGLLMVIGTPIGIIVFLFALALGFKCKGWAKEINKNQVLAFFIGFIFVLLGTFLYWLYYKKEMS